MTDETDQLDTLSVYSDDIVETLASLEGEFNSVIQEINGIHQHHETIIDKLQWINDQPVVETGIYLVHENEYVSFNDAINQLHEKSLDDMEQNGRSMFCENLLRFIESSTFVTV